MTIRGLQHVGLTCSNIDRTIAFYSEIFDVRVVGPSLREGPRVGAVTGYPGCSLKIAFLDFGAPNQVLELLEFQGAGHPVDPATGNAGAAHFAIIIDDVDQHYRRLSAMGHRFVSEPFDIVPNGLFAGRAAYLIDPDGFRIELLQLSDPLER